MPRIKHERQLVWHDGILCVVCACGHYVPVVDESGLDVCGRCGRCYEVRVVCHD